MIHDGKLKLVRYYKKEPKNSFENIWYQLGEKGSERSAIAQPKNKTSAQMVEALEVFLQIRGARTFWKENLGPAKAQYQRGLALDKAQR